MSSYHTQIEHLHYNAASKSFEARVTFHEGADRMSFATRLQLPITTEFETLVQHVVSLAKTRRAHQRKGLALQDVTSAILHLPTGRSAPSIASSHGPSDRQAA